MSGYVNPVFRPDFTDYPAPPQNRLASGFNAIWPASNPVGTETTQGMQSATSTDQIAFMRPDGTPVMQSDLATAHQQVQTAMQVAPTMVLGMMGTTDPAGIRAFHGSPYDFERFDTSKIGTGEGAQAYGHGLYMAENEGVARQYRDVLASRSETDTPEGVAKFWANMQGGHEGGIAHLESVLGQIDKYPNSYAPGEAAKINQAIQYLKSGGDLKPAGGKMYEVNIGADPGQFLHWDKPLSEQSPQVQDAIGKIKAQLPDAYWFNHERVPGSMLNSTLRAAARDNVIPNPTGNPDVAAAQALRDAGIPGIRYLDQGSRGAQPPIKLVGGKPYDPADPTHLAANALDMSNGDRAAAASIADRHAQLRANQGDTAGAGAMRQAATLLQSPRAIPALSEGQPPGTHNYVVFDASTIDILRKYGLAGLGIGLGATAAGTQQQSQ